MISRQVIGITVVPVVTEYHAVEFYDKKKGRNVHSAFPENLLRALLNVRMPQYVSEEILYPLSGAGSWGQYLGHHQVSLLADDS